MTTTLIEVRNEIEGTVKTIVEDGPQAYWEARLREALAKPVPNTDVVGGCVHVLPDRLVLRFYAIGDPQIAREAIERCIEAEANGPTVVEVHDDTLECFTVFQIPGSLEDVAKRLRGACDQAKAEDGDDIVGSGRVEGGRVVMRFHESEAARQWCEVLAKEEREESWSQ